MSAFDWLDRIPRARYYSHVIDRQLTHMRTKDQFRKVFPRIFNNAMSDLLASRGKLLRPILTLCASEVGGHRFNALALHSAVAVELLHVSSLVFDDIIDRSPRRRGSPTVHKKYGTDVAILTAGMLLIRGLRDMAELKNMRRVGYDTMFKLTLGEALETRGSIRTEADYLTMIDLKTAALFEAAMRVGGVANCLGWRVNHRLAAYGRNLGMAFQLRDDVLDFFGSETKVRKPLWADFRNGKPNYLAVKLCCGKAHHRSFLMDSPASVRQYAISKGYVAEAENLSRKYLERALAALEGLEDTPATRCLQQLADFAFTRER